MRVCDLWGENVLEKSLPTYMSGNWILRTQVREKTVLLVLFINIFGYSSATKVL
jgi:hypothetical protein